MIYEEDWLIRQIKALVRSIAQYLFHRDNVDYEVEDEAHLTLTDSIHRDLIALLAKGKICEAEDSLFDQFQPGNMDHLRLALDFYERVNLLTDDELEARNFSRDEILSGLKDIMRLSEMDFYGL